MLKEIKFSTPKKGFIKITREIEKITAESGIQEGICVVYCPHTTAGITINENADPDVVRDLSFDLDKISPDRPEYRHAEGNSDAHLKALMTGSSVTIIISGGKLMLGRWQGIYFAEYDGPRNRTVQVKIMEG
ncbi:MAG: YjbQ family protein [Oscillospiraceae bacterium]|nr:YjbQ family protein [Oscillospiraceae bacterium]